MQYFAIFQDKLHSVNIQDDQSWTFSENVQKMSKITYTASRFWHLKSAKFAVNINRATLQHNKQDAVGAYIWAWSYFEHALLQLKNCHHILPEKANPLLHFFAEPHSLYSMSQSTTKIVSFHDNVWKYAYKNMSSMQTCLQIATLDISSYSPESKAYLSSTDTDRCVFTPITLYIIK